MEYKLSKARTSNYAQPSTTTRSATLVLKMPTYKLYYFNARGAAETIRLTFALAGVEYEDNRLSQEEWAEFKPKTPYGGMPVLDIDGKIFGGSSPILRYLAKQFGLDGEDDQANLILDGAVDTVQDVIQKMIPIFYEKDAERKETLKKEAQNVSFPRYLGGLEKLAAANNAGPWFYGSKVTYADLSFYQTSTFMNVMFPGEVDKYPTLKKLTEAVEKLPKIAEWIKTRPVTDH